MVSRIAIALPHSSASISKGLRASMLEMPFSFGAVVDVFIIFYSDLCMNLLEIKILRCKLLINAT